MSDLAFFRFASLHMLSDEEKEHKDEILRLTEDVLQAHGIECDAKIAKIPEEELQKILEEVRKLRKRKQAGPGQTSESTQEEPVYIQ